jgi:hypothetical protein
MTKKDFVNQLNVRCRRIDIINGLKRGDQKRIAIMCNCATSTVSDVLNGYTGQISPLAIKIMRCAEKYAKINKRVHR